MFHRAPRPHQPPEPLGLIYLHLRPALQEDRPGVLQELMVRLASVNVQLDFDAPEPIVDRIGATGVRVVLQGLDGEPLSQEKLDEATQALVDAARRTGRAGR